MLRNLFEVSREIFGDLLNACLPVIEFDIFLVPLLDEESLVRLEVPVTAGHLSWSVADDHPGVCLVLHDPASERAEVLASESLLVSSHLLHPILTNYLNCY